MQRACLQSNKNTSQQVVGLIGPPMEAELKVNNKIVNNLLDLG